MAAGSAAVGRGADPEATRRRIMNAAARLFNRSGIDAVTVRAVSTRARVTAPAIYWHFGSMDGLMREVMEQAFGRLILALEAAPPAGDPRDRLVAAARIYCNFGLEQRRAYHTMFIAEAPASGLLLRTDNTTGRRAFGHLEGIVQACLAHQAKDPRRAQSTVITIWSLVHGLVALQLAGRLGMDREAFDQCFDESLAALLRGLDLA